MEFRALRMSDCQPAAAIVGSNSIWRDRYQYGAEACARELLYATSHGDFVLGAFDGKLAGFAWVLPRGGFGRSPYLRLLAVAHDAQSRGVGVLLLDACEAHFKTSAKHLFLMVSDFNTRAQQFYSRRGYAQIGAVPAYLLPDVGEQIWVKTLV